MAKRLTIGEMNDRGYVDVTSGKVGDLDGLLGDIKDDVNIHNPSEIVVTYDFKRDRAVIYIPKKDFGKENKK
tara:strand:+ start:9081 stop:9296 length:216 start_codon:yes stop_codon:yes gene_type:complete